MNRHMALLLAGIIIVGACSSGGQTSVAPSETEASAAASAQPSAEAYTIGVVFNSLGHPYTTAAAAAVEAECAARQVTCIIKDPKFDATVQDQMIGELITQNVDAIVAIPVSAPTFGATAQRINDAGIKLINWNTPVDQADEKLVAAFSGPSNVIEGESAATFMHEALGGEGKIIVIEGQAGNVTAQQRSQGFEDGLKALNSGIEIVAKQPADWDRAKALSIAQALLTRDPEVVGIYAHDDDLAQGAIQAAQGLGKTVGGDGGLVVVGIGGSKEGVKAVQSGLMAGTVIQSPSLDGKSVIDLTIRVLSGESVEYWNYIDTPAVGTEEAQSIEGEW